MYLQILLQSFNRFLKFFILCLQKLYAKGGALILLKNLIIFGKLPIKGLVKTRLININLTEEEITELYECFLIDTLNLALETESDKIIWAIYPNNLSRAQKILKKIDSINRKKIIIKNQVGSDVGERFNNIFQSFEALEPQNVLIIGTDSPQLQPNLINEAFGLLESKISIVLGPSKKGGFYLLGYSNSIHIDSRDFFKQDFEALNYLKFAEANQIPLYILEEISDVDILSDLVSLYCTLKLLEYAKNFKNIYFPINTYNFLKKLNIEELKIS